MKSAHLVKDVSVRSGMLCLEIDGKLHSFELKKISGLLAAASEAEAAIFEDSPSGYGIHWPIIDEDISIDGLLGIQHSPDSERKCA